MKKIEIVFKDINDEKALRYGYFDLYFDGIKQENIKRFAIDLPAIPYDEKENCISLDLYSCITERCLNIWEEEQ